MTWARAQGRLVMNDELPLSERMCVVLEDVRDIKNIGARAIAYVHAGINMQEFSFDEIGVADQHALSIELGRRLRDAPSEHDESRA